MQYLPLNERRKYQFLFESLDAKKMHKVSQVCSRIFVFILACPTAEGSTFAEQLYETVIKLK